MEKQREKIAGRFKKRGKNLIMEDVGFDEGPIQINDNSRRRRERNTNQKIGKICLCQGQLNLLFKERTNRLMSEIHFLKVRARLPKITAKKPMRTAPIPETTVMPVPGSM